MTDFVAIDCDRCVILPYKAELYVIADLIWIEMPFNVPVHVTGIDHSAFLGLSDLQLVKIYKNTFGKACTVYGQRLRNILRTACERYPFVAIEDKFKVDLQAAKVPQVRSERYQYVPGAVTAKVMDSKWMPAGITMPPLADEAAASNVCPAVPPAPAPGTRVAPPRPAPRAPAVPREPGAPRAPRASGVRDTIHTVATAMWEAAGKPMDQPTILKLRKEIMVTLENEHGVKRNTSSNELGNWQKQIIRN